jgi:hypothetical protein
MMQYRNNFGLAFRPGFQASGTMEEVCYGPCYQEQRESNWNEMDLDYIWAPFRNPIEQTDPPDQEEETKIGNSADTDV